MKIRHWLVAAAATCAIGAGPAIAHPDGGWGHGEGMEILHSLNLTDAQKEQARTIEKAALSQVRPIMGQMHGVHEQVAQALLTPGNVTADQLAPMISHEQLLHSQMEQIHLGAVLQIRALLTPEQLTQAAATHAKLEALHEAEREVVGGGSDHGP